MLLDDTAVAIALPSLGRDLGLGLAGLEWVVNIYTLAFAVLTLWGGMLADRHGAKPVFLTGWPSSWASPSGPPCRRPAAS